MYIYVYYRLLCKGIFITYLILFDLVPIYILGYNNFCS